MNETIRVAVSTIISGGFVGLLAKHMIQRLFDDVADVSEKVDEVKEQLAILKIKVALLEKSAERQRDRDIKISALEQAVHGHRRKD